MPCDRQLPPRRHEAHARRARPFAGLVLAVLAVAAAGCGSDDGGSASPSAQTTRVEVVTTGRTDSGRGIDAHAIYQRDAPGVVTVLSVDGGGALDRDGSEGSGFVLDGDGYVATNAHVVTSGDGGDIRELAHVYVRFQDGNQVDARIVGYDPNADVALLKIDPAGLTLRPLELARSADAQVGAPVAAIGSPFGEEQSLSVGVISATDRTIDSLTRFSISGAIQTDAAINHGNSGGPLVDASGRVLGINSQIRSQSGDGTGVGFAVPIDLVKRSIADLRTSGHVRYAYLGVSTTELYPQLADRLGLPVRRGVLVADVVDGGPADDAGLRAGDGTIRFQAQEVPRNADAIVAVGGRPVRQPSDLSTILATRRPGQSVRVAYVRGKERRTATVELAPRPAGSAP